MGYAEAIEQQATLLDWYSSKEGKDHLARMVAARDPHAATDDVTNANQRIIVGLGLGQPFWVNPYMVMLIAAAERSWLDNAPFTSRHLPESHGFIWFASPLPLPLRDDGARRDLHGLSWTSYAEYEGNQFVPIQTDGVGDSGVHVVGFTRVPNEPIAGIVGSQPILFSDAGPRAEYPQPPSYMTPALAVRMVCIGRYFRVFCALVAQRVLTTARRAVTNRGARRRLARTLVHIPDVHVVELRRRDYQQRDESDGGTVEWSCQWLVRGHWHRYHTREGLQPRWVMPYVKGDPDKPLRVAEKVAYEVVR